MTCYILNTQHYQWLCTSTQRRTQALLDQNAHAVTQGQSTKHVPSTGQPFFVFLVA